MGAYFLFVNPAKRQYLDPSRFGEGIKAGSLLHGQHGFALSLLLCDTSEARLGYGALAGAWCGDAVYAASDEAPPDLHGLATATPDDPQRNLNSLARDEYEDVSYPALAMLGENEWTAGSLVGGVARALRDPGTAERRPPLLGHLGNTVLQTGCKPLAAELTQQLGGVAAWQRLYAEACEAHRLLPTPSYGAPDPRNALWVLPPAVRPGVVARGRRTARGPAW